MVQSSVRKKSMLAEKASNLNGSIDAFFTPKSNVYSNSIKYYKFEYINRKVRITWTIQLPHFR